MSLDESLNGRIRVSVVATGIDNAPQAAQMPKLQVVNGGPIDPVAFPPQVQQPQQPAAPAQSAPVLGQPLHAPSARGSGYVPEPPAAPLVSRAYMSRSPEELAFNEPGAAPLPPQPRMAPSPHAAAPEPPRSPEPSRATSIFKSVFGFGSAAKQAPQSQPVRHEPAMHVDPHDPQPVEQYREPARAAVRPVQIDEIGLEIPAFLRRNNS
jgi:cell division protein FtsZ